MTRRILLSLALVGLALLAGTPPARALEEATIALDEPWPTSVPAGQAYRLGFTVKQNDRPIHFLDGNANQPVLPYVVIERLSPSESRRIEARRDQPLGHFVLDLVFPSAGFWTVELVPSPFPGGHLALDVLPAGTAASPISHPRTWLWDDLARVMPDGPLPSDPRVGQSWTLGFTIMRQDRTPVQWGRDPFENLVIEQPLQPYLLLQNRDSGETWQIAARPTPPVGHFVADLVFPTAGTWDLQITPAPYPPQIGPFAVVTVGDPPGTPRPEPALSGLTPMGDRATVEPDAPPHWPRAGEEFTFGFSVAQPNGLLVHEVDDDPRRPVQPYVVAQNQTTGEWQWFAATRDQQRGYFRVRLDLTVGDWLLRVVPAPFSPSLDPHASLLLTILPALSAPAETYTGMGTSNLPAQSASLAPQPTTATPPAAVAAPPAPVNWPLLAGIALPLLGGGLALAWWLGAFRRRPDEGISWQVGALSSDDDSPPSARSR